MNVLIVEDSPSLQLTIEACCRSAGVEPYVVADGAAAVEAIKAARYDLVLMDVHMPVMDGIAATAAVRKLPGPPAQTLIFGLTGDASAETRAVCLAAGMQEVLPKPLRIPQLSAVLDTVRDALRLKGAESSTGVAPKTSSSTSLEEHIRGLQTRAGPTSVARIHYLNLDQVKEKLGSHWSKVADRVAETSRQVITRYLGDADYFETCDTLEFLIVFATLDQVGGRLKCLSIAREIARRLFGEESGIEFEVQTVVTELQPSAALASIPTRASIIEALRRADEAERRAAQPAAVADRGTPGPTPAARCFRFDPFLGLKIEFEPVWDTQRQKFPIRIVRPLFISASALEEYSRVKRLKADDDECIARLDFETQTCLTQSLDGYATLEAPALITLPVHYQTLAKSDRRRRYAQGLLQLPDAIRRRLIVSIQELPHGILAMRLAEIQAPLLGHCLNTTVSLDAHFRDFSIFKNNHIPIVACNLDPSSWNDQSMISAIPRFAAMAQRAGLVSGLANLGSRPLAEATKGMFRYLSGLAISDTQRKLSNSVALKL